MTNIDQDGRHDHKSGDRSAQTPMVVRREIEISRLFAPVLFLCRSSPPVSTPRLLYSFSPCPKSSLAPPFHPPQMVSVSKTPHLVYSPP